MNSAARSSQPRERPRHRRRGRTQGAGGLLRLPLILILIAVVTTNGAVTWTRLSCRTGGATIGAGTLGPAGLTLPAGG